MWRGRPGRKSGSAPERGAQPRTRALRGGQGVAPGRAQPAGAPDDADGPACGWFESSRLLREGAAVHEHEVLDPIVNELPLAWWIEWAGLAGRGRRP